MALGGIVTWAVVPVGKLGRYLLLDPELHRKRRRAMAFSVAVAAAVILLVGIIRFPVHVDFAGVVQPDDPPAQSGVVQSGILKAGGDGRVIDIGAQDGQIVAAGQTVLQLTDPTVQHELDEARGKIAEFEARSRQAAATDLIEFNKDQQNLILWQEKLAQARQRMEDLTVKAPFGGRLIAPHLRELRNTFLSRGDAIGSVAVLDKLVIKGDIDQKDSQLVQEVKNFRVEVRLAGLPEQTIAGGAVTLPPAAVSDLAHPSLGQAGGGDIAVDPHDPKGMHMQNPQFEARVKLENPNEQFYAGQRAFVRLTLARRPLAWQWTRRFLQLLQTNDTGKWL
jgi:multidrug efflux pump subunit AcrA (membrane-fusion protein)